MKRRKVASAPPPPSYTGFSSLQTGPVHRTVHHSSGPSQQPNLERVGQAAVGKPLSVRGSKVLYVGRSGTQPTSAGVQRLRPGTSSSQQPATSTGGITPSSRRVGRELRDRIIRQETQVPKPPPPPQSASTETQSLPDISSDLSSSTSLASLPPARVISPPARVISPPARVLSPPARVISPPARVVSPPARVISPQPQGGRNEAAATVGTSSSATRPTAGLSSNMAQLLQDLKKSPLERREEESEEGL